jgi:chromosome segregation ATPase
MRGRLLTITREEEWQSLLDERTQEMETMSEQLSQLQKQVEFANTQSEMFRQTINTTKQSAQQQASALQQNFEAKFKKQNEARLRMLHSFLGKRTQADQEAWEASITTRQDQDEVVSRLDDQLREAKERMPTSSSQPRPSWSSNYQLSKAN